MNESIIVILYAVAALIMFVGSVWLLIRAFRTSFLWGLICLVFSPAFIVVHFRKAWAPLLVILLGMLIGASGPTYNQLFPTPIQTKAVVIEDTMTLTKAERTEYSKLQHDTLYKAIQWANADVTDDDAAVLEKQIEATFIDLTDSQVTDKTLEQLVKLPKLQKLYIARTKITPEGVKKHILDNPNSKIQELDVRGLKVPGKQLRDWKELNKEVRKFNT